MIVPEEAVKAAARACWEHDRQRFIRNGIPADSLAGTFDELPRAEQAEYLDDVRPLMEAAHRFIGAPAWEQGYQAGREYENHNHQHAEGFEFEPIVEPDNPYGEDS